MQSQICTNHSFEQSMAAGTAHHPPPPGAWTLDGKVHHLLKCTKIELYLIREATL